MQDLTTSIRGRLLAGLHDSLAKAHRHPRRVAAGALIALGGFGATAFGIAPLAPDAANLPVSVITESLAVPGLSRQADVLAEHDLQLLRGDVTRAADNADSLLRRLGVSDPLAARFLRQDSAARRLFDGRPGKMVQVRTARDGTLLELVARFAALDPAQLDSHFLRLTVSRQAGVLSSGLETAALVPQVKLGSGTVRTSLWAAADDAHLPEDIARQLIDIFSKDMDFHRQLKRGASFRVVYEALTADDQPVTWGDGIGRIVAAEFTNNGQTHEAMWFADGAHAKGGYYNLDGKSQKNNFLASPLEFSRVTSGFAMRMHPIMNTWRAHNGVDYAAPTGTPVYSVGDGVVEFAGRQSGYGNVVEVRHDARNSTLYAHLSQVDVKVGDRLKQGQTLGQVGATGWATGPHLHFEFRIDGQFQDPLQVAAGFNATALDPVARQRFEQVAAVARHQLDAARSLVAFRGDAE